MPFFHMGGKAIYCTQKILVLQCIIFRIMIDFCAKKMYNIICVTMFMNNHAARPIKAVPLRYERGLVWKIKSKLP